MKLATSFTLLLAAACSGTLAGAALAQSKTRALPDAGSVSKADSLRGAMQDSTRAFLHTWRLAWFASRRDDQYATEELRKAHAHCHERTVPLDEYASKIADDYVVLKGTHTAAAFCPSWSLSRIPSANEESDSIDTAISNSRRAAVRGARERLIALLAAAQDSLPHDTWITGQRVRLLVDQGRNDDALEVARRCSADTWWCSAFTGYVLQREHNTVDADSAFATAGNALQGDERCAWIDIGLLLPPDAMGPYLAATCAEREKWAVQYWWLADPLFSVAGNERRVEHFARRVTVLLHSALDEDEKYHWQTAFGGDAVEQLIVRYGWPSKSVWMGASEDVDHDRYMQSYHSPTSAPYSTNEYQPDRIHFGPAWSALNDPMHAKAAAWELNAPGNMRTAIRGRGDYWWPVEHMRFSTGAIVQLPPGQTAFFRRQHDIELATAVDTDRNSAPELASLLGRETTTALMVSTAPDSMQFVERYAAPLAARIVLSGVIVSRPALLAIEASVDVPYGEFARTRFGITPPLPLDSLPNGTLAISDPVFFEPLADALLPTDVTAMLPHMLGSASSPRGAKVGLYWENYGVSANDSVHYAVNATLVSNRSFFQRLTSALKLSNGGVSNVAVSWTDPRSRTRSVNESNAVPILPRSIVLDLASLSKGTYSIEITVTAKGRLPAQSRRVLTIR